MQTLLKYQRNFSEFTDIILGKENFQAIKGESLSLQNEKWGQNIYAILALLREVTDLKIPHIINFLKNNVGVSRTTIRKGLVESDYKFVRPIIKPKNTMKERRKRRDWRMRQINQEWTRAIFSDETTIFLENPGGSSGFIKNISEVKIRKQNTYGNYFYGGKFYLEIFEDNLNTHEYIKILLSKLGELKWLVKW